MKKTVRELEMLSLVAGQAPKSMDEAAKKRYKFWETQPVPKLSKQPSAKVYCLERTVQLEEFYSALGPVTYEQKQS